MWALVGVIVAGLGVVAGLASVLKKELGLGNELIVAVVILGIALVAGAAGTFIWLLARGLRGGREARHAPPQLEGRRTNELAAAPAHVAIAPVAGTDEAATRALEAATRDGQQ